MNLPEVTVLVNYFRDSIAQFRLQYFTLAPIGPFVPEQQKQFLLFRLPELYLIGPFLPELQAQYLFLHWDILVWGTVNLCIQRAVYGVDSLLILK